jgi:hypothetical protein
MFHYLLVLLQSVDGRFTRANGRGKSLVFAFEDIFSVANLVIAIIAEVLGYVVFNFLRKRL